MKKTILVSLVFFCVMILPSRSHAQSSLYFGGRAVMEITCTCSAYTYFYFTPLYLNSGKSSSGALALSDVGVLYANYYLVMEGWALGHYTSVTTSCLMEAGEDCITLTTQGLISQTTGTSL